MPPQSKESKQYKTKKRINWSFVLGASIILIIAFLAFFGPFIAPRDPLEQHTIIQLEGEWYTPPVPFLTPTFPLGSDSNGRDLLSRLLHGIKPTMQMVLTVAAFRLTVGTIIGLIAGWSHRLLGRFFDSLISAALAVPVLIVALGGIAAVGVELGVTAFIIGLSITGWVETARIVRDQTETIRGQQYIEASQALGAPTLMIIRKHVLRQIASLIWVLFAFEISGTLMLTAALGFLGYYIGGDVWVQVEDRVAEAISGAPELGQMLATSRTSITQPWGLIAVGTVVFITVLGFNFLGEGLRLSRADDTGRRSAVSEFTAAVTLFFDQYLLWPVSIIIRSRPFQIAYRIVSTAAVIAGVGWVIWQNLPRQPVTSPLFQADAPRWSSANHDPYATYWSQAGGPKDPTLEWLFEDTEGFSGGPAITNDGVVFIASNRRVLYALTPQGEILWRMPLPAVPVGSPAIGQNQMIYITDLDAGLTAYNFAGDFQWYFTPEESAASTASAVVSPNGNIFYTVGGSIQAVSPQGQSLWKRQMLPAGISSSTVHFTPDGSMIFLENIPINPQDGSKIERPEFEDVDQFMIGADGQLYIRIGQEIYHYSPETGASQLVTWDEAENYTLGAPQLTGVTPDNLYWLFYHSFSASMAMGSDLRIVWLNQNSRLINNTNYPIRNSQVIGFDHYNRLFTCGNRDQGYGAAECQVFSPDQIEPLWTFTLEHGHQVVGGAVIPNRMYVAAEEGFLYALGTGEDLGEIQIAARQEEYENLGASIFGNGNNGNGSPSNGDQPISAPPVLPLGPQDMETTLLLENESGFSSRPITDIQGNIYTASNDGLIYSLTPHGDILWQTQSESPIIGDLLISDEVIYSVHKNGRLSAWDTEGSLLWEFIPEDENLKGLSGPVIDQQSQLYYTLERSTTGIILSLTPEGQLRWQAQVSSFSYYKPPIISADGQFVFFDDQIFLAADGVEIEYDLGFEIDSFVVGENGQTYLITAGTIAPVFITPQSVTFSDERVASELRQTLSVGITPSNIVWLFTYNAAEWYQANGESIGYAHLEGTNAVTTYIAAVDNTTLIACGLIPGRFNQTSNRTGCAAFSPESETPAWTVQMGDTVSYSQAHVLGGVLTPGQMFITTETGQLWAVGSPPAPPSDTASQPSAPTIEYAFGQETEGPEIGEASLLIEDPQGFTGGMNISSNGILYIGSAQDFLYALDLESNAYRTYPLPATPTGSPAFMPNGDLLITGRDGSLTRLSPPGEIIWQFHPENGDRSFNSTSIDSAGNAYYIVQRGSSGYLQAVSPAGEDLWQSQLDTGNYFQVPEITPDESMVFLHTEFFNSQSGQKLAVEIPEGVRRFFVGQDNNTYYLSNTSINRVQITQNSIIVLEQGAVTNAGDNTFSAGVAEGGVLRDGTIWFRIDTNNGFQWYSPQGDSLGFAVGNIPGPQVFFRFVAGHDQNRTAYACGNRIQTTSIICVALSPDSEEPLWWIRIGDQTQGFDMNEASSRLANGKLYISTEDGLLTVISDTPVNPAQEWSETTAGQTSSPTSSPGTPQEFLIGSRNNGPENGDYTILLADEAGFNGGMSVTQDGKIYIPSRSGAIHVYDLASGQTQTIPLSIIPIGQPIITETGDIYIADKDGGASKLNPQGELLWHFQSDLGTKSWQGLSLSPDGTIFYIVERGTSGVLHAVSNDGQLLWTTTLKTGSYYQHTPQISPDGLFVFVQDEIYNAQTGEEIPAEIHADIRKFILGQDNKVYYLTSQSLNQIQITPTEIIRMDHGIAADVGYYGIINAGITEQGFMWVASYSDFLLFDQQGDGLGILKLGVDENQYHPALLAAIDNQDIIYTCSFGQVSRALCGAVDSNSMNTLWVSQLDPPQNETEISFTNAKLINEKLYISFSDGRLVVFGQSPEPQTSQAGGEPITAVTARHLPPKSLDYYLLGPSTTDYQLAFDAGEPLINGLSVNPNGKLTITTVNGIFYQLDYTGQVIQQIQLPTIPQEPACLSPTGSIIYLDTDNNLTSLSPEGTLSWQFPLEANMPISSPIFTPEGNIYIAYKQDYTGYIHALSPDGQELWNTQIDSQEFYRQLFITPDDQYLLYHNEIIDTQTGLHFNPETSIFIQEFLVGRDNRTYIITDHRIHQVLIDPQDGLLISEDFVPIPQRSIAVQEISHTGSILFITHPFENTRSFILYNHNGTLISSTDIPNLALLTTIQTFAGIDINNTAYLCGSIWTGSAEDNIRFYCMASDSTQPRPLWVFAFEEQFTALTGGAVINGRIFLSTDDGRIITIGQPMDIR